MNIINPIYAIITASYGGNILYADGSRTNVLGRLKTGGAPAGAPDDAHEKAMAALAKSAAPRSQRPRGSKCVTTESCANAGPGSKQSSFFWRSACSCWRSRESSGSMCR